MTNKIRQYIKINPNDTVFAINLKDGDVFFGTCPQGLDEIVEGNFLTDSGNGDAVIVHGPKPSRDSLSLIGLRVCDVSHIEFLPDFDAGTIQDAYPQACLVTFETIDELGPIVGSASEYWEKSE